MAFNSIFDPTIDIGRDPSLRLNPRATIIDQPRGVRRNRDDFDPEIARLQAMLNEALRKRRRTGSSTEAAMPPSSTLTASSTLPATSSRSTALVPVPGTERIQDVIATVDQNPREAAELVNSAIHSGAAGVNNPQFLAAAANYANAAEAPAGVFGAFRKFANAAKLKGAELAGAAALFFAQHGGTIQTIASALGGVGVITNIIQNRLKRKSKEKIAHEQMELERAKLELQLKKEKKKEKKDFLKQEEDRIQHKMNSLQALRNGLILQQRTGGLPLGERLALKEEIEKIDIQIGLLGEAKQWLPVLMHNLEAQGLDDYDSFVNEVATYFQKLKNDVGGLGEIRKRKSR